MPPIAHVHTSGALCAECCRQLASPRFRAMAVLREQSVQVQKLLDYTIDGIGDVLFGKAAKGIAPESDQIGAVQIAQTEDENASTEAVFQSGLEESPMIALEEPAPILEPEPEKTVEKAAFREESGEAFLRRNKDVGHLLRAPEPEKNWHQYLKNYYSEEREKAIGVGSAGRTSKDDTEEVHLYRDTTKTTRAVGLDSVALKWLALAAKDGEADEQSARILASFQPEEEKTEPAEKVTEEPVLKRKRHDWNVLATNVLKQELKGAPMQRVVSDAGPSDNDADLENDEVIIADRLPSVAPASVLETRTVGSHDHADDKAKRKGRHNHSGRAVCEECMALVAGNRNAVWAETKENLLVAGKVAWLTVQGAAIGIFGTVMVLFSLFHDEVVPTTQEEADILAADRQARKKKQLEDWEAERDEWEEKKQKAAQEHDVKALEYWNKYEQKRLAIKDLGNKMPEITDNNALREDDQRIREINSAIARVENGKDDPALLQKMMDELYATRSDRQGKERRRDELFAKMKDEEAKTNHLLYLGKLAMNAGEWDRAEEHFRKADDAYREAERVWRSYLAV
jgi:hypothetical protein